MKREPIKGDELKKKAVDEEDDSMENEDEMEEKSCGTKKSVEITEDDLMKSVEQLEAFAKADDPISRKNELLEKAQKEDLTDSEKDELFKALGKEEEEVVEEESVTKSFEDNEDMQKSLDVSDYLSDLHTGLVKALGTFEAKQTASDSRQHEFNILLAKSVAQVGKLMKSLNDRMEGIESQPISKPRSTATAVKKSFVGVQEQGERLSKSEVMDQLMGLAMSEKCPPDLDMNHVIAKFESTNVLDKRVTPLLNLTKTVN